jgi:hypothetical protein
MDILRLVMITLAAFLLGVQVTLHFVGRPVTGLPAMVVPLLALVVILISRRKGRLSCG